VNTTWPRPPKICCIGVTMSCTNNDTINAYVFVNMLLFTKHTHTRLTVLCPGLPRSAGTRKVKPIWILLKQETVSGSGISWAICKSAPHSRQITMPVPHRSVFYRPDALPAAQPTASKHWRHQRTEGILLFTKTKHNFLIQIFWGKINVTVHYYNTTIKRVSF